MRHTSNVNERLGVLITLPMFEVTVNGSMKPISSEEKNTIVKKHTFIQNSSKICLTPFVQILFLFLLGSPKNVQKKY